MFFDRVSFQSPTLHWKRKEQVAPNESLCHLASRLRSSFRVLTIPLLTDSATRSCFFSSTNFQAFLVHLPFKVWSRLPQSCAAFEVHAAFYSQQTSL